MKVKGIKRGNTIELLNQTIDIPDGTEITLTIEESTDMSTEVYLARLQALFAQPELPAQTFPDASTIPIDETPLTSLIGSAPGSFATPEEADRFIRQERDAWDY